MQWLNEPASWRLEDDTILVTANPHTDTWREPKEGGIRSSGHFYFGRVEGDFRIEVGFSGEYRELYDQAGIMLRVDDRTWMKCGVELVHGVQHASVVMTREWSDWSILAIGNPEKIWIRVERKGAMLFVYYSLDGSSFTLMRKGYFSDAQAVDAGIMIAAPQEKGFSAVFEGLSIKGL